MSNASMMSLQVAMSMDMMAWCLMAALERDASADEFFRTGSIRRVSLAQPAFNSGAAYL